MKNFFKQNRNILVVALSVFIVSMTALMLFLNNAGKEGIDLHADVLNSETEGTETTEVNYRELFEKGEDPFAVIKLDGHILFTSANFEETSGFSGDNLRGRLFFSLIEGEDLPTFFSAFGKVVETGKPVTMVGPFKIMNRQGEYRTGMGSVYPVMEEGKVMKIGIMIKDITGELDSSGASGDESDDQSVTESVDEIIPASPVTTTNKKVTNPQKFIKPADPKDESPATQWKKPKNLLRTSDPSWITGEKLVMLFPFNVTD